MIPKGGWALPALDMDYLKERFSISQIHKQLCIYLIFVFLVALSYGLYSIEMTSLLGGFVFSFSLLGFFRPLYLLVAFMFFVALGHKDFTYLSLDLSFIPLYITEWTLFILLATSIPTAGRILRKYPLPTLLVLVYFAIGSILFFLTMPNWGASISLRHFAIVYYAFFIFAVFAHVNNSDHLRWIIWAIFLGVLPNLAGEFLNFLYNTLPANPEQNNYSLRNSFYFLIAAGFCVPFVYDPQGKKFNPPMTALFLFTATVIMLYSYSKTAMITLFIMILSYVALMFRNIPTRMLIAIALLLTLPFFITPPEKTFSVKDTISFKLFQNESRQILDSFALRDFTEYPYGIGFGPSIFGKHLSSKISNVEEFHSLHNSYIALLIRTGIMGGIAVMCIVLAAFLTLYHSAKTTPKNSLENKFSQGLIFAAMPPFIFPVAHVALEGPFFGTYFWIFIGLMIISPEILNPGKDRPTYRIMLENILRDISDLARTAIKKLEGKKINAHF